MWHFIQEPIKLGYHPVKLGGHRYSDSGDKVVLVCHVILKGHVIMQDHVIKVLFDFIGSKLSR